MGRVVPTAWSDITNREMSRMAFKYDRKGSDAYQYRTVEGLCLYMMRKVAPLPARRVGGSRASGVHGRVCARGSRSISCCLQSVDAEQRGRYLFGLAVRLCEHSQEFGHCRMDTHLADGAREMAESIYSFAPTDRYAIVFFVFFARSSFSFLSTFSRSLYEYHVAM